MKSLGLSGCRSRGAPGKKQAFVDERVVDDGVGEPVPAEEGQPNLTCNMHSRGGDNDDNGNVDGQLEVYRDDENNEWAIIDADNGDIDGDNNGTRNNDDDNDNELLEANIEDNVWGSSWEIWVDL